MTVGSIVIVESQIHRLRGRRCKIVKDHGEEIGMVDIIPVNKKGIRDSRYTYPYIIAKKDCRELEQALKPFEKED